MLSTQHQRRAIERDLTRLADGTLEPDRRERVERLVASSGELQARLGDQRRALDAIRTARGERAPLGLRIRTRAIGADARRRPRVLGLALAGAVAALVWGLSALGGGQTGPTVADAATVAALPPTMTAPGPRDDEAALPRLRAAELPFPYWEDRFGWRATGVRTDRVDSRTLTTVFYSRAGRQIAYSIVAGPPLAAGAVARTLDRNHVALRSFVSGERQVVTWLRQGHTCVLSGVGVPLGALTALAAWRAHGELPY
jgi:hypothetical protein